MIMKKGIGNYMKNLDLGMKILIKADILYSQQIDTKKYNQMYQERILMRLRRRRVDEERRFAVSPKKVGVLHVNISCKWARPCRPHITRAKRASKGIYGQMSRDQLRVKTKGAQPRGSLPRLIPTH